jgi:hypothetical protein
MHEAGLWGLWFIATPFIGVALASLILWIRQRGEKRTWPNDQTMTH